MKGLSKTKQNKNKTHRQRQLIDDYQRGRGVGGGRRGYSGDKW